MERNRSRVFLVCLVILTIIAFALLVYYSYQTSQWHESAPVSYLALDSVSCHRNGNVTCDLSVNITTEVQINGTLASIALKMPEANKPYSCGTGLYHGPGTYALSCDIPITAPPAGTPYSGSVALIDGESIPFSGTF